MGYYSPKERTCLAVFKSPSPLERDWGEALIHQLDKVIKQITAIMRAGR